MTTDSLQSVGHGKVTVSTTAVALPSIPTGAGEYIAIVQVTQTVNVSTDGTNPDSTTGYQMVPGKDYRVYPLADIKRFMAIRAGSVDAVLNVAYFRRGY